MARCAVPVAERSVRRRNRPPQTIPPLALVCLIQKSFPHAYLSFIKVH
jgi:hypothetical protein